MSGNRGSRFKLVEEQGWSDREVYEGESLEEIAEFLEMKTGSGRGRGRDRDDDDEEFFPEVDLL